MRLSISALLELGGISSFVWGFHLISPFLGFIVGGIGLFWVGLAVDPPASRPKNAERRQ